MIRCSAKKAAAAEGGHTSAPAVIWHQDVAASVYGATKLSTCAGAYTGNRTSSAIYSKASSPFYYNDDKDVPQQQLLERAAARRVTEGAVLYAESRNHYDSARLRQLRRQRHSAWTTGNRRLSTTDWHRCIDSSSDDGTSRPTRQWSDHPFHQDQLMWQNDIRPARRHPPGRPA